MIGGGWRPAGVAPAVFRDAFVGIVSFCPQGHRVKVKAHLAGRKGICPTCGARFRIPLTSAFAPGSVSPPAPLPAARLVSLDAALAADLPRVVPLSVDAPQATAVDPALADEVHVECEPHEPSAPAHPLIAERPDLAWCLAVAGGKASDPLAAPAMQAWLESGAATGNELVWRADWADWRPIGTAFPEYFGLRAR
jgi:hypothetical protein